jgi:ABC-type phosphate transport system auxiliary subunit
MYDIEDERGVPISSGVPPIVTYAGIAGVVLIFIIAALVLSASGYGHMWPSENTLNLKL